MFSWHQTSQTTSNVTRSPATPLLTTKRVWFVAVSTYSALVGPTSTLAFALSAHRTIPTSSLFAPTQTRRSTLGQTRFLALSHELIVDAHCVYEVDLSFVHSQRYPPRETGTWPAIVALLALAQECRLIPMPDFTTKAIHRRTLPRLRASLPPSKPRIVSERVGTSRTNGTEQSDNPDMSFGTTDVPNT